MLRCHASAFIIIVNSLLAAAFQAAISTSSAAEQFLLDCEWQPDSSAWLAVNWTNESASWCLISVAFAVVGG